MPGHSSMWEGNRCHWVSIFWKPGTFRHNNRVRELLIPILKMRKPSFAEAVSAHDHVVGGGRARLQPRAPIPRLRALIAIPREAPTAQTWATGHLSARHSLPLTHTSAHPCTHTYTRSLPLAYSHTLFLPSPAPTPPHTHSPSPPPAEGASIQSCDIGHKLNGLVLSSPNAVGHQPKHMRAHIHTLGKPLILFLPPLSLL